MINLEENSWKLFKDATHYFIDKMVSTDLIEFLHEDPEGDKELHDVFKGITDNKTLVKVLKNIHTKPILKTITNTFNGFITTLENIERCWDVKMEAATEYKEHKKNFEDILTCVKKNEKI